MSSALNTHEALRTVQEALKESTRAYENLVSLLQTVEGLLKDSIWKGQSGNVSLPSSSSKPSFLADYSNPTPGDSGPSSKTTQIFMPKTNQSLTKINLAIPNSPLLQRRESRSLGRPHVNSTFEGPISGKRKSSATSIPERIVQVFDGFRRDSNGIRRTSVDKQRPPPSTTLIVNDSETKQVQPMSSTVPLSPSVNSPLKIQEPNNHEVCMKSSIIENHDSSLAPKRVEADNSSLFSLIVHDSGSNDDEFPQEATMNTFHEVLSQPFSQIGQRQTSMLSVPTFSNPAINNTNITTEEFNIKKKALSSIEEKQQISSVSPEPEEEPLSKEVPFNVFLSIFLLPAFDGKGKIIDVELFDKEDTKNVSFLVNGIHPKSYFHTLWDLLTVCASLAYLWYIPFLATFSSFETHNSEIVSLACTITFTLDTVVELATPKPSEINPLCSLREYELARPSLSSWIKKWIGLPLIMEIIPIIPFTNIFQNRSYRHLLILIRLLRFYRLPACMSRCAVISRTIYWMDKLSGFALSAIIPILIGMMIFLHFSACSLYYFGKMTGFIGWSDAWSGIENAGVVELYSYSFFKAVGNMFPCAFPAQTAVEQLVASFYVIVSAVLYAAFLGAISSSTMSINPSGKLFAQKMDELSDYVKWKNLKPETTKKIFSYYETKYRGKFFEEEGLLLELNDSLRTEISMQNTQALLERVPFLHRQMNDGRDGIFLARLSTMLHANYFVKNDFIVKQGDYGFDMYFILSGMVNVIVNGKKVASLHDGAYFGEVALLTKVRTSSVQATAASVLYRLTFNDFHSVINEFDDMKIRIKALTKEYEERLKTTSTTEEAVSKLRKKTIDRKSQTAVA